MAASTNIGDIHARINYKGTVQAWAQYTIRDWWKEQGRKDIGITGRLGRSFKFTTMFDASGELVEVRFNFKFYGRFLDMGVGKGTKLSDVKENATSRRLEGRGIGNARRPKKWYNQPFYYNYNKLAELLAGKLAKSGQSLVIQEITRLNEKQ